jgi:hypothetical protein
MPRLYTVSFSNILVAAAQDMFQINGPTAGALRIRRVIIGSSNTTLPTAQMLSVQARFLPSVVTNGSGGTAPTAQKLDPGDANPNFSCFVNNTTPASTTGTAAILYDNGFHIYNGLDEPEDDGTGRGLGSPVISPGEAWVFQLLSTVSGAVNLSGTCYVEAIGW